MIYYPKKTINQLLSAINQLLSTSNNGSLSRCLSWMSWSYQTPLPRPHSHCASPQDADVYCPLFCLLLSTEAVLKSRYCLFLPFYSKSCLDSTSVSSFWVLHSTTAFLPTLPSELFNLSDRSRTEIAVAVGERLLWYSHITRYTNVLVSKKADHISHNTMDKLPIYNYYGHTMSNTLITYKL
jgi:hypothetical protein